MTATLPRETRPANRAGEVPSSTRLTSEDVWRQLSKASFAVVAYVTPAGEPRSSGVVYAAVRRRLYVAVAPDGWKARHIVDGQMISVTVPVRRGGVLSLALPIPPATITFLARAIVHPAGSLDVTAVSKSFARLVPEERRGSACVLELVPEGRFVTFGVGVSLGEMRDPAIALAHVPVA